MFSRDLQGWPLRIGTIGCALAGTLVLVSSLASAGALKERSVGLGEFEPGDPFREATARCERGQRAVAGGFSEEIDPPLLAIPLDSTRDGKRGWRHRAGANEGASATAYVYCDKHGPKLKTKSSSAVLGDQEDTPTEIVARCRRGQEAVAGGFDMPDTEALVASSKRKGKRRWAVTVVGGPGTYQAFAYCDKSKPGLKERSATLTTEAKPVVQSVVAKCKRKQQLRSGGFQVEFADTTSAFTLGSRRSGKRGWEASAYPLMGAPELTAYAYCDKKKKKS